MIAVVDYHKGNLKSVERGLIAAGAKAQITDNPEEILRASAIVLPGVGAFTDAMQTMNELGQAEAVLQSIKQGRAFLGICLGLHLLFEGGEEHAKPGVPTPGLGVFPGVVKKMPSTDAQGLAYKVPHVGWNQVTHSAHSEKNPSAAALFDNIKCGENFYFTHSYISPASEFTAATTTHSIEFPSAVAHENVLGVQFHPEKSSDAGAALLKNFVNFARKA